tara:strand:- start:5217 stop:6917 length:1701 start_codon:yes stop_codon:yes gene_type:complete
MRPKFLRLLISLGLIASVTTRLCEAQVIVLEHHEPVSAGVFGLGLAAVTDVDGDGIDDYAVGSPGLPASAGASVAIRSGATGAVIHVLNMPPGVGSLGSVLSGYRLQDDSNIDYLLVGNHGQCQVYMYSVHTGDLVLTLDSVSGCRTLSSPTACDWFFTYDAFGSSVIDAGDLDGDGIHDIVVGARLDSGGDCNAGSVHAFSGLNGVLLYSVFGTVPEQQLGWALASLGGDVDQDGVADFVVGAPGSGALLQGGYCLSGATGQVLHSVHEPPGFDNLGWSVGAIDDHDGDGVPEFILGGPFSDGGGVNRGVIRVYSGQTGLQLHVVSGTSDFNRFGWRIANAGDMDGDRRPDLAVTSQRGDLFGAMTILSGSTFESLWSIERSADSDGMGWSVAGIADVTQDGFPEILVGIPTSHVGGNNAGGMIVASGCESRSWPICSGAPTSTGSVGTVETCMLPGGEFRLNVVVSGLPPLVAGFFIAGRVRGNRVPGNGLLCLGIPMVRIVPTGGLPSSDLDGVARASLDLSLHGDLGVQSPDHFLLQFVHRDSDPVSGATIGLSTAVEVAVR